MKFLQVHDCLIDPKAIRDFGRVEGDTLPKRGILKIRDLSNLSGLFTPSSNSRCKTCTHSSASESEAWFRPQPGDCGVVKMGRISFAGHTSTILGREVKGCISALDVPMQQLSIISTVTKCDTPKRWKSVSGFIEGSARCWSDTSTHPGHRKGPRRVQVSSWCTAPEQCTRAVRKG